LSERIHAPVADDVEALRVRHDRRVFAVGVDPDRTAVPGIQPIGAVGEGREVDDPVDDARRAGDLAVRAEAPADIAGRGLPGSVKTYDCRICGNIDDLVSLARQRLANLRR